MIVTKSQIEKIISHAKKYYPQEVCGIITGIKDIAKKIYKMKNVSDKPEICYFMKPEEQLKVFKG
ncbi:MAG: hypothetical protein Q7K21_03710, partial [Elusimicrobiota bacterium]|nr:hypothetical protein [Elusimicrobiota bacterium]